MFRRNTSRFMLGGATPMLQCAAAASSSSGLVFPKMDPNTNVKLIECPRDAMQGLRDFVPTHQKIRYMNSLLKCGFDTLDCGSFVSAPAVPQMRDTQEVLDGLDMSNTNTKLLVVIANLRGAKAACAHERVSYVGYPLSCSETFQLKNTKRSVDVALNDLAEVQELCKKHNKHLVTYISMGFGNPYGEEFNEEIVAKLVEKVAAMDCKTISLADTVGVSQAPIIKTLFQSLMPKYPNVEFGAHFHSGVASTQEKISAAMEAGCRRFDHAVGGMGGCPFAKSTLVGNVPTEGVVETLEAMGVHHGIDTKVLEDCTSIKHDVFGVAVKELVLATTLNNEKSFTKLCLKSFRDHDVRNVWWLNQSEFGEAVTHILGELGEAPPTQERIDRAYAKTDLNNSGRITLDEYMFAARKMLKKRLDNHMLS